MKIPIEHLYFSIAVSSSSINGNHRTPLYETHSAQRFDEKRNVKQVCIFNYLPELVDYTILVHGKLICLMGY